MKGLSYPGNKAATVRGSRWGRKDCAAEVEDGVTVGVLVWVVAGIEGGWSQMV